MEFDPTRAETRFGCGMSPVQAPPGSVDEMLDGVLGRDVMADRFPIPSFAAFGEQIALRRELRRAIKSDTNSAEARAAAVEDQKKLNRRTNREGLRWLRQAMQRRVQTGIGFRERLVAFWADHFTAYGKAPVIRVATGPFVEDAIRPHIAGRFEDILIAAVTHPLMLHFLDQDKSIGPNSAVAQKRAGRGLNENLAREVLELHSLGVDGPYTQDDVRQLAELLTGLNWTPQAGLVFRKRAAEPGAETVLGKRYGGRGSPGLEPIHAVLRDLARHPATARHISSKLAVHFVADRPPEALIRVMTARYQETDGDLVAVYEVMLRHPDAWSAVLGNIKRPIDFVATSLRALAVPPARLEAWSPKEINRFLRYPLERMGQPWERPLGPDGWTEEDSAWATPQGMAGRLQWALGLPELLQQDLPDPRSFVEAALGPEAPERVRFAARAAETRREGIALVLMAPAFQRV